MKARCYDKDFRYVRAADMRPDHLKRLFDREKKRLKEEAEAERNRKVQPIRKPAAMKQGQ